MNGSTTNHSRIPPQVSSGAKDSEIFDAASEILRSQSSWYQSRLQIARTEFLSVQYEAAANLCISSLDALCELYTDEILLKDLKGKCSDQDLRVKYISLFLTLLVQIYYEMGSGAASAASVRSKSGPDGEVKEGKTADPLKGVQLAIQYCKKLRLVMHPIVTRVCASVLLLQESGLEAMKFVDNWLLEYSALYGLHSQPWHVFCAEATDFQSYFVNLCELYIDEILSSPEFESNGREFSLNFLACVERTQLLDKEQMSLLASRVRLPKTQETNRETPHVDLFHTSRGAQGSNGGGAIERRGGEGKFMTLYEQVFCRWNEAKTVMQSFKRTLTEADMSGNITSIWRKWVLFFREKLEKAKTAHPYVLTCVFITSIILVFGALSSRAVRTRLLKVLFSSIGMRRNLPST
eukprot:Nk52_evm1s1667 gene=Nk52_evmTU1s1667